MGTVGADATGQPGRLMGVQVLFPLIQIIHDECQMRAAVPRVHRLVTVADQMQFLIDAQAKPGPGEIEIRTIHRRQTEDVAIKRHAHRDIGNMQCDVIELMNFQLKT